MKKFYKVLMALGIMPLLFSMERKNSLGSDEWSAEHDALLIEIVENNRVETSKKKRKKLSDDISLLVLQQMADNLPSADDEPVVELKDVPFDEDQPGDESLPTSGESSEFPSKEFGSLRTPSGHELDLDKLAQWEIKDGKGKGGRAGRQARVNKALSNSL